MYSVLCTACVKLKTPTSDQGSSLRSLLTLPLSLIPNSTAVLEIDVLAKWHIQLAERDKTEPKNKCQCIISYVKIHSCYHICQCCGVSLCLCSKQVTVRNRAAVNCEHLPPNQHIYLTAATVFQFHINSSFLHISYTTFCSTVSFFT